MGHPNTSHSRKGHYLHPIPGWDIINIPSQEKGKILKKKIKKEKITSHPRMGHPNTSHPRMGHYLHPIPGWDIIYIPSQDGTSQYIPSQDGTLFTS